MSIRTNLSLHIDMAAGRIPCDTLIDNCRVADVFSRQILPGPVALGDGKVIAIGEDAAQCKATRTIDAGGGVLIPGLIDAHVHIESSALTPSGFARTVLPHGTTTVIADPHEIANVCGLDGIRYMLEASENLPLNVRIMLPSCVPATPFEQSGAELKASDLEALISHPRVQGIGEVMDYPGVINASGDMLDKIGLAHTYNKVADGHSPGLIGRELAAYAISGIKTDHECSNIEEMHARIRQGMYVQIRMGSACRDLPNLIHGVTPGNARRCLFCTDDREPGDIIDNGHINQNLRLAVELGLDPVTAITIATLNSAECYGLKGKGAIAPGYDADLVLVDNLQAFNALRVFTAGKEIARDQQLLVELADVPATKVTDTVNIAPVSLDDLRLEITSDSPGKATARMIQVLPDSVLTKADIRPVSTDSAGLFQPSLNPGLNKLAVIERHHASGNVGVGILADYGLTNGAIATSIAHDSHNIVVVGDNDADMLTAIEDIKTMGGGICLCREGKVLAHLPLPVAGLMSEQPAAEVAEEMRRILSIAEAEFGINAGIQPVMTLVFMTLPVIPELKLTANGLFDVTRFEFVSSSV